MMPTQRSVRSLLVAFPLSFIFPFLQSGCGDDSRTGGTQTQINNKRDIYKANAEKKALMKKKR
jgi:hypothetical protein